MFQRPLTWKALRARGLCGISPASLLLGLAAWFTYDAGCLAWMVFRRLGGGHHRRVGPPRDDQRVSNENTDRSAFGSQEARP